jgi:hypothetical protein
MSSGGMPFHLSLYRPSADLKSGIPLAVETPAPPKNTILRDLPMISLSFAISSFVYIDV